MNELLNCFLSTYFINAQPMPLIIVNKLNEITKDKYNISYNTVNDNLAVVNIENLCDINFTLNNRGVVTGIDVKDAA